MRVVFTAASAILKGDLFEMHAQKAPHHEVCTRVYRRVKKVRYIPPPAW